MKVAFLILLAAVLALFALGMSSCAGLSLTVTPDGKISATYTVPPKAVVIGDKGSK